MKNINSHIQIPNAVLKQFRDEKDPEKKVWYLDLATGEVKRSASGKLGTEKGYYSEGIEQFWSATIESPIAALNARIRKSCDGCEGNSCYIQKIIQNTVIRNLRLLMTQDISWL